MAKALQRILSADDEADIREVLTIALEAIGGYTVEACSSGQTLLDQAVDFNPDVIVLDVMMPGMDGPATLQALQRVPATKDIPVIFITAKAMPAEIERFIALGAIGVITKPFDPMTVSTQVEALWGAAISQSG